MGKHTGGLSTGGKVRKGTKKVEKKDPTTKPKRGRAKMAQRVKKLDNPSCDCDLQTCKGNRCEMQIHNLNRKYDAYD